jgi:hypothetical protein
VSDLTVECHLKHTPVRYYLFREPPRSARAVPLFVETICERENAARIRVLMCINAQQGARDKLERCPLIRRRKIGCPFQLRLLTPTLRFVCWNKATSTLWCSRSGNGELIGWMPRPNCA